MDAPGKLTKDWYGTDLLISFYGKITGFIERFSRLRFWKVYLALLCSLYCIFANVAPYNVFRHGQVQGIKVWHRVNGQIDHPFVTDTTNDPESHEARLTFRLVPPLIGALLPTENLLYRMLWLFVVQNICGFLFFYLLIAFAERTVDNRVFSFLLPWCFVPLYVGKTFFNDAYFFFDGLAYFFLFLAVYSRRPVFVFAGLLLAFFTDERAIIGSGFVLLYHVLQARREKAYKRNVITVVLTVGVYFGLRFLLQSQFEMTTPAGDIRFANIARHTYFPFIVLGVFTAFKSFWLLFLIGAFCIKGFWPRSIYLGTLLAVIAGGVSVFDFSRSVCYGFVGLLAVFHYLRHDTRISMASLNALLCVLIFTSMLNPLHDVHRNSVMLNRSFIGRYLEAKFTRSPADRESPRIHIDD